ncbi:MAG: putative DNA binding domain-containing protein [Gammaproteobacteria bacterium]|nr:putative DNA binding domain-containing protein [Gammaproteobacteria bacterium]
MNVELLDRILEAAHVGETTDWEFKSAKGGFPGSYWETYSAMANSEGGVVVLGVSERDGKASPDGLTAEQTARYQKTLWDGLNNRGQVSINLMEPRNVEVAEVGGAALLVIRIPRATRTQRPVYAGTNPFGNTYRRRHEGDYRCNDAEVRRMLADADEVPPDHRILTGFSLDDTDAPSLAQYRQRLRAAKGEHPWLALSDRDLLERLGGWRRDRTSATEGLTLAGLLMFGKDQAIRDPNAAPNYFVDYREKLDPELRWTDRIYPDGTWEANLFQYYSRVWPKLSSDLPTPFKLEGAMRRDVTPAHEALREAFVNALIHADYAGAGGVVIERYPDRFVVENPGTLLVSVEQYLAGGVSECRNKSLQQMFLMIGGGERAGSGTDKIRAGWRAQHWRAPRLEIRNEPDRIRLTLPMVSLIPAETLDRLRGLFGPQIDALTSPELQALATAEVEGSVSNTRLQELLAEHPVDITRMLTRLCDQGLLVSDNRRRWTTYRFGGGPIEPSLFDREDSSHLPGDSSHLEADSSHLTGDSSHLPESLDSLRGIAAPVAEKGKSDPTMVRSVILELCAGRYLTAEELGILLNRNPDGLRSRYLSPMVGEGLLRLRYPTSANRPDQAYITEGQTP